MKVKKSDNFASDIKEAKKEKGNIFIVRLYQTTIFYIKPNIKMQHLSLSQNNFIIPEVKYNKRDLSLNATIN